MSDQNDHRQFLPEDPIACDRIVVDVPPAPAYIECVPKRSDVFGRIYQTSDSNRRVASGTIPWWVLGSSWFMAGMALFVGVLPLLSMPSIAIVFGIAAALLPVSILWRETAAKLSARHIKKISKL